MKQAVAVLVQIMVLTVGAIIAAAESPPPGEGLQIEETLDAIGNHDLVDAIISMAPSAPPADLDEPETESSTIIGSDWVGLVDSGVGYPVTQTISLGLAYHLEEIEDLTAELIEIGTAGVDYSSHKVLVRALWQFDLIPLERLVRDGDVSSFQF